MAGFACGHSLLQRVLPDMLRDRVHKPGHPGNGPGRTTLPGTASIPASRSLRDELLNKEIFDSLDNARRKPAFRRQDCNAVRPHSSLGNLTPREARRTPALPDGAAPGAPARKQPADHQSQARRRSL
ncbi:transposase [Paracoccus sp. MC1854]|nr:transposase [Paracoccus sp. MC1854]